MPLAPGQTLKDRYRIVRLLGQGGFGAVYRAWDTTFDIPCAIKENNLVDEASQRQFAREARLLRTLRHPNLPLVTDYFAVEGQGQYLVMDFVDGEDLEEKMRRTGGPLPEAQVIDWIAQVCDALSYLHGQEPPVIHRDIKPANIRITPEGRAMLVDFGIAKVHDPEMSTTEGARAVTSGFSPPEQYGKGATDARSDVYALGATCYALLTGQAPPDSVDLLTHQVPAPQPAQWVNTLVSPEVSAALERAMRLERDARWGSVEEFEEALAPTLSPVQGEGWGGGEKVALTMPVPLVQPAQAPARSVSVLSDQTLSPDTRRPKSRAILGGVGGLVLVGAVALAILAGNRFRNPLTDQSFTPTAGVLAAMPSETSSAALTATAVQLTADIPQTATPQPPAASSTASRQPPTVTHTAIASPQPTTLPTRIVDDFGVTMALVPAGEFQMGCDPANKFNYSCDSDELPLHTVYLDDFYIDIFEVTNAQFSSVVNEHGNQKESVVTWLYHGSQDFVRVHLSQDVWKADSGYEDHPVVGVSWYGARAFCEWRGSRLPTEAEWEKAARGANDTRAYPWGDQKPSCSLANFLGCVGGTSPVGSYPQGASPYGVLDMAGNVHEWLNDWYQSDYYIQSPTSNPLGPTSGSRKVYRGGIYISPWHLLRVSFRTATFGPGSYTKYSGIRCAASPGK